MRAVIVAGACFVLISCGPNSPEKPQHLPDQSAASEDNPFTGIIRDLLGGSKKPAEADPPQPDTPEAPLERSLGVYSRGAELDPNDLGALARITEACGGPWSRNFLNEPLALQNGRAIRDGNVLRFGEAGFENPFAQLSGGYGPRDMDAWEYHYFGVYAGTGLDVVHVQYSEGNGYILADSETRTLVEFQSLPTPSPSGKYFASPVSSEMTTSAVEVVERTAGGLKFVATFESDRYPCGLTWLSDTKATFRELGPGASPSDGGGWRKENSALYRDASIELLDGKWIYSPAK